MPVTAEQVQEVCGSDPTWVCRRVLEETESDFLAQAADWTFAKPLVIVLIFIGAWVANRVIRRAIRRFVARAGSDRTRVRTQRAEAVGAVLRSVATAVIYTLAAFVALGELGLNLGPLIAGAGVVGVALGFGAQSLVRDFLTGLFMIVEDQFGVGDVVDVGAASGTVEGVSLRTTRIRDSDGVVWYVPNGEIHRVGNKSQDWARALLDVPLAAGTDVDRASTLIGEIAGELAAEEAYQGVILEPPEVSGVQDLGKDGIAIRLVVKTKPGDQFKVERELRIRLARAFATHGINAPVPEAVAPTDTRVD